MTRRDRSVPYKRPYGIVLVMVAVHYLSLVGLLAAVVVLVWRPEPQAAWGVGGCAGLAGVTWLVAYLKRRGVRCPLCRGTPYLDSGALTHRSARRVVPFNHGTTALLGSLFTGRFRCMYCGTRFDLLKVPSGRNGAGDGRA